MRNQWFVIIFFCYSSIAIAQTELKLVAPGAAAGDVFGISVAVDGDTAVVGAYGTDPYGAVFVYTHEADGAWVQQGKLTPLGVQYYFGRSVSIDGDTIIVGDDPNESATVFVRDGSGNWTLQTKLTAFDSKMADYFGYSVSISGDTAVVGAYWDDESAGVNQGSAYVFTRDGAGTWAFQEKLTASDATADDKFGYSVSVDGDTVLIGAPLVVRGSAYVFTRDGAGTWTEQAELVAADGYAGDNFGNSVSLDGDTALIGSYKDSDAGSGSGSAYIFTRDGIGSWTEGAKLTASDAITNDHLGVSVSLSGDTALAGAYYDDGKAGSAYIFMKDVSGAWTQRGKLTASDRAINDYFGRAVAVGPNTAVVGAYGDQDAGYKTGATYIYSFCGQSIALVDNRWKLIALPCSSNRTVEEHLNDDGLGVYGTDWAMIERIEDSDSYRQLQFGDILAQGVGYWIKVVGVSPVIDFFDTPTDDSIDFEVSLVDDADPGRWNLMGHPFDFDVAWSDVIVADEISGTEYLLSDIDSGNYVDGRAMYTWNGNSYQSIHPVSNPGSLSTCDGFWIRVKNNSSMLVPPTAVEFAGLLPVTEDVGENWWVQLIASSGDFSDPGNRLGRMDVSSDDVDEYDLEELEAFASPYFTLVFPHPEWETDAWAYTTDFRQSRSGAGGKWDFEIRADSPRQVTLSWQGAGTLFSDILDRSMLFDEEYQTEIDPSIQNSVAITMAGTVHRLSWNVNATPMVEVDASGEVMVGEQLTIVASFTDEDPEDNHSAVIDWADGVISEAKVDQDANTLMGTYIYREPGQYRVEVCVADQFGTQGCAEVEAKVTQITGLLFADGFESGDMSNWE